MCGIVGGWWKERDDRLEHRLKESLECLKFRGPNDKGIELYQVASSTLALGHTRLSVIDLSYGGHQPMFSMDNRYALIFNGEIYNYIELQKKLKSLGHVFKSNSDTEVLLQAWMRWGESCISQLKGMFAFIVYDRLEHTVYCVRDAFGIKPFYLSHVPGKHFIFASELPALLKLRGTKSEVNWQRSYDYLVQGDYDNTSETFVEGVQALSPGHFVKLNARTGRVSAPVQWWSPKITEQKNISFASAADQLRNLFLENIRLHLRSDVPLGAALSGGIDSSALVCGMRYIEPQAPIDTFSYIAQDSHKSEEKWVDIVNLYVKAKPHKVFASGEELVSDLEDLIRTQGEPFGSTSIYAQYRVFKLAKEAGMTVTLEGQGADELLAGYKGHPGYRLYSLLSTGHPLKALSFASHWSRWPGRKYLESWMNLGSLVLPPEMYRIAKKILGRSDQPEWINSNVLDEAGVNQRYLMTPMNYVKGRMLIAKLADSLQGRNLPALLRHGDRNSMRFSIEGRVPFLTTDMADFLLSLPEHYLLSNRGETKHVFREAMRGIVPEEILNRKDKIGFETPEKNWLFSMAPTLRSWLQEDLELPFLNHSVILNHFDLMVEGKIPFSWQLWRWVNYSRWYLNMIRGS